jgi:hypothetical protein
MKKPFLGSYESEDAYFDSAAACFTPEEWERAKNDTITLGEVHEALSHMPGSLSDAVIESREERC